MKKIKAILLIAIATILLFELTACSSDRSCLRDVPGCLEITPPTIRLTGEKTPVENQIVGEYNELEQDAWSVSSVKTNVNRGEKSQSVRADDEQLLRAIKIREFNSERIREYKNDYALGESNSGYIVYKSNSKYDNNKEARDLINRLISEENKARETIFIRTLILSGVKEPTKENIASRGTAFADEQRALSQKNDLIQEKSGEWVKKQ